MNNKNLTRLSKILFEQKRSIILSVFFGVGTIIGNIGLLGFSAYLICRAALEDSIAPLLVVTIGVRFFGLVRPALRYLERLLSHNVTFKFLSKLRQNFYENIEALPTSALLKERSGDLLSRIASDVDNLKNFYLRVIYPIAIAVVTFFVALFSLAYFSFTAAKIFAIFYIVAGFILPYYISKRKTPQEVILKRSHLQTVLVDGIKGMAELKSYGASELQKKIIMDSSQSLIKSQDKKTLLDSFSMVTSGFLSNSCPIAILFFTALAINNNNFDSVYLASVVLISLSAFEAVIPLANIYHEIRECKESSKRLYEITDRENNKSNFKNIEQKFMKNNLPENLDIKIIDLTFYYDGDKETKIKNLYLEIPFGTKIAIKGQSGSGKTTLANLFMRLWDYEIGSIKIGEVELKDLNPEICREIFSLVPQNPFLFNASIRENIFVGKINATQNEIENAAEKANIKTFIESLPQKYETILGNDGMNFSGGQRTRLAVARAIIRNSPIIILDEVTASLDSKTEEKLLDDILIACSDKTIILITHRQSSMNKMSKIFELK
ncbi:MAG: thiol reductant ABC exporter subunit CydC [Fusobacteriaceae bacterium]